MYSSCLENTKWDEQISTVLTVHTLCSYNKHTFKFHTFVMGILSSISGSVPLPSINIFHVQAMMASSVLDFCSGSFCARVNNIHRWKCACTRSWRVYLQSPKIAIHYTYVYKWFTLFRKSLIVDKLVQCRGKIVHKFAYIYI